MGYVTQRYAHACEQDESGCSLWGPGVPRNLPPWFLQLCAVGCMPGINVSGTSILPIGLDWNTTLPTSSVQL